MTGTPTTPPKRRGRRAPTSSEPTPPSGPCRICVYIRRSTDDEHQPFSLDAQRAALEKYVRSHDGWTIVAEYEDDASGASTDRPGLKKALAAAKAGLYDVLLVYRLDRFSRSVADLLDLIQILEASNVRFSSATEPVDTGGPFGRMMLQLLAVFAEFERNIIIDRVKSGMTAKASKGKWTGGTRAIATELNERGIPNRVGKQWSGHTINRILDNPAYVGDIAYRDVYVTDAHEPLIDRDTFRRAKDIADARGDTCTQRAMSGSDYYLTGLLTCPQCGQRYIGTSARGRTRRYRYYTCFTRTRYGKHATCTAPRLPAYEIDQLVLTALYDFYTTAEPILTAMIERANAQRNTDAEDRHAELIAVTNQITAAEAAIARYHQAFENGSMDDTTAGPRIRELRSRLAQLQARHAELDHAADEPVAPPPGTIARIRDHLATIMTSGTATERKAAVEALIHEVQLTDQGVIPVFKIPTDDNAPLPSGSGADEQDRSPVRTMVRSVDRRFQHTNRYTTALSCSFSLPVVRERRSCRGW